MTCYSDATVMLQYHRLIARSRASLDSSGSLTRGFWSWFYKLTLFNTIISGQSLLLFTSATIGAQTKQGLEKGRRAWTVGERCTASRGTHHGDGRSAVQKKNPAMAWLYQWRRALPCLHLFVLLRKRGMGVRYAQPGTESSPLGPGTAQLIFLQGSRWP